MDHRNLALVALSRGGLALARRLQPDLPGARVHGLRGRAEDADIVFADTAGHLRRLFAGGSGIVGICAAGILIRALAPLLANKRDEPPVLALAEDGSAAIPLLGGHRGANDLARRIADLTGGHAAVTTAGDLRFEFALDDPPPGWRVANPETAKPVMAALLAGEPVRLDGMADWLDAAAFAETGDWCVRITERADMTDDRTLVLHPPMLAVGIGCERDAAPEEVLALVRETLAGAGLAAGAVAAVASIDLKADEPAVHAAAAALGVPARFFDAAELEAEAPRLATPSELVFHETGCHGVAEGAALALAGPDSRLVVAKRKSKRATCAVAQAPHPVDPRQAGRERGSLAILGIGPGDPAWRTPEATAALCCAEEVVGYRLYLDLAGDLLAGKRLHESPLGEEAARVRLALERAAAGYRVALVSSGDPGIYALAALAFELLDRTDDPTWNRIAVEILPGISALQAAAARAGAPLGHDFCAISLSDLLTPRATIRRRIEAAAAADFVVAFYNPQSRRRRDLLREACGVLAAARPPETPVIVARNLGRPGETVTVTALSRFDPESVDMLTLIIVGNSETRTIHRGRRQWTYTPRGYAGREK